mmetsp:Transcript_1046/g.2212  ORF Transcript_1046/g.2212 Transcript_1046/m.2212 type:complete len:1145 (-) Transcript_1046:169-3603(-)
MPHQDEPMENISSLPIDSAMNNIHDYEDEEDYDYNDSISLAESNNGKATNRNHKPEKETFTQKETIAVNRSKVLVYIALLLAAAGVGVTTYTLLSREQTNVFEIEFEAVALEIVDQTEGNVRAAFAQLEELGIVLTAQALSNNSTWPFVTLPYFDSIAQQAMSISGMEVLAFAPLVKEDEKLGWEAYTEANQAWIAQDLELRKVNTNDLATVQGIHPYKTDFDDIAYGTRRRLDYGEDGPGEEHEAFPLWQFSPPPSDSYIVNMDVLTHPTLYHIVEDTYHEKIPLISRTVDPHFLLGFSEYEGGPTDEQAHNGRPRNIITRAIFDQLGENAGETVVGVIFGMISWDIYFNNVLPEGAKPILVEVGESCTGGFTYLVTGDGFDFLGWGINKHDSRYDKMKHTYEFAKFATYESEEEEEEHCSYIVTIYPTDKFRAEYITKDPLIYTSIVVSIFVITTMVFLLYDCMVQRRQIKLLNTAQRTNAIVASLFPKDVQKRIMDEAEEQAAQSENKRKLPFGSKAQMKEFINTQNNETTKPCQGKPIADLFPETTILFADLVGFTAWSSKREPTQVFELLEAVYGAFDEIAKRRGVFKVETVGDCYVAVVGLPDPRKDHAATMCRFARDCLYRMDEVVKQLMSTLGPETAELGMRFGINSGPVTAGVLRGERARFQLFGDTMNTTSRIETTGKKGMIHISQSTAELLQEAGKGHWIIPREDKVVAKGKGELITYWMKIQNNTNIKSGAKLETSSSSGNRDLSTSYLDATEESSSKDETRRRLIDWNVEMFKGLLTSIHASRRQVSPTNGCSNELGKLESLYMATGTFPFDEVQEAIKFPSFEAKAHAIEEGDLILDDKVVDQLRQYVTVVASLYNENSFHNFEHASHVVISAVQMLSQMKNDKNDCVLPCDPLTQFAMAWSALIHDIDHQGVPNAQLVFEGASVAAAYQKRSVAEQNSFDIGWKLLMDNDHLFLDLRRAIYSTAEELQHFRQLAVNLVLATDLLDEELRTIRKTRWEKAFVEQHLDDYGEESRRNYQATVLLEHVIQAADIAHTMEHWNEYQKWNQRLFAECFEAYQQGRAHKKENPSECWYRDEIAFFDSVVIPLAHRLNESRLVFADSFLQHALENNQEWMRRGPGIVQEMVLEATS